MAGAWQLTVAVPEAAVPVFEAALEGYCTAIWSDRQTGGIIRLHGYTEVQPETVDLSVAISVAAAANHFSPPTFHVAPLYEHAWENAPAAAFPAFTVGRFLIHGSTESPRSSGGTIPLRIDARMAFGSGRHATTATCLTAISCLAVRPRRVLDLGCGSGILSVAMAKLWRTQVLAADIDPISVADARDNAIGNGVRSLMRVIRSDGYASAIIRKAAPFDLIVANILPQPLKRLARQTVRHLKAGGHVILSGFLASEGQDVLASHQALGTRLVGRVESEGWQALVLRR